MSTEAVLFNDLRTTDGELAAALRAAVTRVVASGWFVLGPEGEAFEAEAASAFGVRHAVGVASGTDAITLALLALGIGPGDEVVTSPLTACFTALGISRAGARPVFADVDRETLNLSPEAVRERLSPRTRAVLPVHLYGNPCSLDTLAAVADEAGVHLVEDACQAHGASLDGRRVGSWGSAGCFSFYPTKNLGALGDGGMLVTNDEAVAERARRLRNGGQSRRYVHEEIGINSRLDELQAAVLRVKLPRLSSGNERRRRLAEMYRERLAGTPVRFVEALPGSLSACHLFVVRAPRRDELREGLARAGIQTLVHYPVPVHLQPAYRDLGQGEGSCPEAERAAREIVSLPLHPGLDESSLARVAEAVRNFYA